MAGGFKLPPGLLAIMSVDVGGDGGAGGGEVVEDTEKEVRRPGRNSE